MTSIHRKLTFIRVFTKLQDIQNFAQALTFFIKKIDKLKIIFENYPKSFVDSCIKKYVHKIFIKKEIV